MSDTIVLYLRGRLGNQMFQLSLANILSKSLGRKLSINSDSNLFDRKSYQPIPSDLDLNDCEVLNNHIVYSDQLMKAQVLNKTIVIDGWFQRYGYYRKHKPQLLNLFRDSIFRDIPGGGDSDIVIHLRTTDYRKLGPNSKYIKPVPIDYFKVICESQDWENVHIVTDNRNDEMVLELQSFTGGNVVSDDPICDFNFIRNSKNIVLSTSTFSWWAAWLSEAKIIFYPQTGNFNPLLRPDIDLKVSEQRYNYCLGNSLWKDFRATPSSPSLPKMKQLRQFGRTSSPLGRKIYAGEKIAK